LTWQATTKHKINFSHAVQNNCSCYSGSDANAAPESSYAGKFTPDWLTQATWNYPATNRLLFEAGTTVVRNDMRVSPVDVGASPNDIAILELSNGYRYNARSAGGLAITGYTYRDTRHHSNQVNERFSTSYITGSQAIKVGMRIQVGEQSTYADVNRSIDYTLLNGVPRALTLWAAPLLLESQVRPNLALY